MTAREDTIDRIERVLKLTHKESITVTIPRLAAERAVALLKEQEAKPPVHIHEEYPEHDWKRNEKGYIDDFAYDGDYHNGPVCKRCHYSFCIHCDPNGWNKEPCIIDIHKCPKCGRYIIRRTKFCSDCGQAVKWE